MESMNLILICVSAFIAVFALLSVLAIAMRLILVVFPAKEVAESDSAVVAALASTINSIYPESSISKIEEIK